MFRSTCSGCVAAPLAVGARALRKSGPLCPQRGHRFSQGCNPWTRCPSCRLAPQRGAAHACRRPVGATVPKRGVVASSRGCTPGRGARPVVSRPNGARRALAAAPLGLPSRRGGWWPPPGVAPLDEVPVLSSRAPTGRGTRLPPPRWGYRPEEGGGGLRQGLRPWLKRSRLRRCKTALAMRYAKQVWLGGPDYGSRDPSAAPRSPPESTR